MCNFQVIESSLWDMIAFQWDCGVEHRFRFERVGLGFAVVSASVRLNKQTRPRRLHTAYLAFAPLSTSQREGTRREGRRSVHWRVDVQRRHHAVPSPILRLDVRRNVAHNASGEKQASTPQMGFSNEITEGAGTLIGQTRLTG